MNRYVFMGALLMGTVLMTHAPVVTGASTNEQDITVSFDSPFPASWYKKSIDSTMRLWGDLEALLKARDVLNNEDNLLQVHSALGQLVYVHHCIEQLNQDNKRALYADDGAYLDSVLCRLSAMANQVTRKFSYDCTKCFCPLIEKIRRTLDQIPQAQ